MPREGADTHGPVSPRLPVGEATTSAVTLVSRPRMVRAVGLESTIDSARSAEVSMTRAGRRRDRETRNS